MERKFTLSCCSTVDLPYSYMQSRDIPVLFYTYVVDGQEYVDDMGRDPEALPRFYRFLEAGKLPQTSQINVGTYLDFFEAQLEKGDLLHIAFTSGQSGSVHNAVAAAKLLQEKYPDKKLVVIDSLCSSSGYGLLVDGAADLRDAGKSMDEIAAEFEGKGYGDFKMAVAEVTADALAPVQAEYGKILADKAYVDEVLKSGAERASRLANRTVNKVYRKVGLLQLDK